MIREEIEKAAWKRFWERNPDKLFAGSSRPDLVIGFIDGYNYAIEHLKSKEVVSENILVSSKL